MTNKEKFDQLCLLAQEEMNSKKGKKLTDFLKSQKISIDFTFDGITAVRFFARKREYETARFLCKNFSANSINLTLGAAESQDIVFVEQHLLSISQTLAKYVCPHIYAAYSGFLLVNAHSYFDRCTQFLLYELPDQKKLITFILISVCLASGDIAHAQAMNACYIVQAGLSASVTSLQANVCYHTAINPISWVHTDNFLNSVSKSAIKSEELVVAALTGFIAVNNIKSINEHCPESHRFIYSDILLNFVETFAVRLRFYPDETILRTITFLENQSLREALLTLIPKSLQLPTLRKANSIRQIMVCYRLNYLGAEKLEHRLAYLLFKVIQLLKIAQKYCLDQIVCMHIALFLEDKVIHPVLNDALMSFNPSTHYYLNNSFFTQKSTPIEQKIQFQFSASLFYRKTISQLSNAAVSEKLNELLEQYNVTKTTSSVFSKKDYELLFRLVTAAGDAENMRWLINALTSEEMDINAQSPSSGKSALHFLIIKANEFPDKKNAYNDCLHLFINKALLSYDYENKTPKDYDTRQLFTEILLVKNEEVVENSVVGSSNCRSTRRK